MHTHTSLAHPHSHPLRGLWRIPAPERPEALLLFRVLALSFGRAGNRRHHAWIIILAHNHPSGEPHAQPKQSFDDDREWLTQAQLEKTIERFHTGDPDFSYVTREDAGYYTLLATDLMGCNDQKSIQLIVNQNPQAAFHGIDTLEVPYGYVLEAGTGNAFTLNNDGINDTFIPISICELLLLNDAVHQVFNRLIAVKV